MGLFITVKSENMITVTQHGEVFRSRNPRNGVWSTMQVVIFEEQGNRGGANRSLSESSAMLDRLIGEETGLEQTRTHSQPIQAEKVARLFPIGWSRPGYINRELHSRPQMWNQEGRPPRMIDGRPTYFKTLLADNPEDDKDLRDSNEILAKTNPELFQNIQTRVTDRVSIEPAPVNAALIEEPGNEEQQAKVPAKKRTYVRKH